jgi:Holliday junction resolvase RusA-like endonuclease
MIVIHGEIYSTKNSKQIVPNRGKTGPPYFIVPSGPAKKQEAYLIAQFQEQRASWERMTDALELPLVVKFRFFRKTRARFDYVNMAQGPLDAMVKAGLIEDDNMNIVVPAFDLWRHDKEHPRLEIEVVTNKEVELFTKPQVSLFD